MRRVDGGPGLAGVLRSGSGVLGRRSGEQAKEQAEWNAGVLVMLVHVRGESGGICSELATPMARWRLLGSAGARGRVERAPARGNGRWRRLGATRGCQREAGGGRTGPPRRAAALHSGGAEKQSK